MPGSSSLSAQDARHIFDELRAAPDFYTALTDRLDHLVDLAELRRVVSDVAWEARARGLATSLPPDGLPERQRLAARYYYAQRLRFDFKFNELGHWCRKWLDDDNDALLVALAGFAAFGQGEPAARSFVNRSLNASDADTKSRQACLHALWFSQDLEDLGTLLKISKKMISQGEGDANIHYRRAGALRRRGAYDEALREIDSAIERLASGTNDVHGDYARERELIVAVGGIHGVARASVLRIEELEAQVRADIAESARKLETRVERAETIVTDSLFRTIEVLGLFLALTGFVVGSATAAVTAETYWKLILAMGLLIAGSLSFLLMMRWVISSQRSK